ncbi:TetR-like C-terminal domain-containing protein [Streptomyces sp. NPDC054794]
MSAVAISALLCAVRQAALAQLAAAMETELAALPSADDPVESARAGIRALATSYLRFAQAEPGLFRAAFSTSDMADTESASADGPGGLTAFLLLGAALDDLVKSGALPPDRRPGAEYFVWSAVHGLAVLLIDGPLRGLLPVQAHEAGQRLMDSIERGI